jgi:hypothetical protein
MDQTRGAFMVGGVVGILAALASMALGMLGFVPLCGCITGPLNWVLPAFTGLAAGAIAAMRADWSEVAASDRTGFGVGLGLRAGGVASAIAGIGYFLVGLISPILSVLINAMMAGADDLMAVLMVSLVGMGIGMVFTIIIAVISTLVGIGLGAAGGAVVGASKGSD